MYDLMKDKKMQIGVVVKFNRVLVKMFTKMNYREWLRLKLNPDKERFGYIVGYRTLQNGYIDVKHFDNGGIAKFFNPTGKVDAVLVLPHPLMKPVLVSPLDIVPIEPRFIYEPIEIGSIVKEKVEPDYKDYTGPRF